MEQYFSIARVFESRDMSVGNRETTCTYLHENEIHNGDEHLFFDRKLKVISIDDNEMTFAFMGVTYKINREWQVIGTPSYDISNMYVSRSERFVFFFSAPSGEWNWEDEYHELEGMIDVVCDNADNGEVWKNIPLVKRMMHIIKDLTPKRDEGIDPALRAYFIEVLLKRDAISITDTPRLYQSLCEYYRLCLHWTKRTDYNPELERDMDKYYFRTVDEYIYKLAWIVGENELSGYALEQWNYLSRHLKVDPIQSSEKWEEVIYDVEKELDEELKDESRGMGFCHAYWSAKKAALARREIEWKSPRAMNPGVMFD